MKLENLLCDTSTRPPRVKLCDFGHAIFVHDLRHDRQFFGTPGYAAPEVTQGPVWSHQADVWAMGVVMYALLSNSLPFEGDEGWRRPADLSSRMWWRVSVEAKLLLQALLEANANARGSLETYAQSAWGALNLSSVHRDEPMRHAFSYSDMTQMQRTIGFQAEARRLHMPHAASWNCLEGAAEASSGGIGAADEEAALMAELMADDGVVPTTMTQSRHSQLPSGRESQQAQQMRQMPQVQQMQQMQQQHAQHAQRAPSHAVTHMRLPRSSPAFGGLAAGLAGHLQVDLTDSTPVAMGRATQGSSSSSNSNSSYISSGMHATTATKSSDASVQL